MTFVRAGSARVVLTVRKGWEEAWTYFVLTGNVPPADVPQLNHPYMTIAQEIAAYDSHNYPGIAPANPGKAAVRLQDAVYTTCSDTVAASPQSVLIPVTSSAGFVVGLPVVIDTTASTVQEAPLITAITDTTHIEVKKLDNAHNGKTLPFPVLQPGEKGALIAEWNEYTPSSGTDIAVTSNLTTIS